MIRAEPSRIRERGTRSSGARPGPDQIQADATRAFHSPVRALQGLERASTARTVDGPLRGTRVLPALELSTVRGGEARAGIHRRAAWLVTDRVRVRARTAAFAASG